MNFKTKKVAVNGEQLQVQVWDTAGQEHFHKITTSYYRGAHGIMLVYDVADSKTMDNAEYWCGDVFCTPFLLCSIVHTKPLTCSPCPPPPPPAHTRPPCPPAGSKT